MTKGVPENSVGLLDVTRPSTKKRAIGGERGEFGWNIDCCRGVDRGQQVYLALVYNSIKSFLSACLVHLHGLSGVNSA
jgi:hypothetical protein